MDFHSLLICPICNSNLKKINDIEFECVKCSKKYRVKNEIPVLIENDTYYKNN